MANLNCLGRWSEQWEEEAHYPKTCNYPFTIKYKSPLSLITRKVFLVPSEEAQVVIQGDKKYLSKSGPPRNENEFDRMLL